MAVRPGRKETSIYMLVKGASWRADFGCGEVGPRGMVTRGSLKIQVTEGGV